MPAKRKYKVKGTKDFIVLAGIFFFLCLWAAKDAWYTSPKVMERHPQRVEVSFDIGGSIGRLHVNEGDSIGKKQPLAELRRTRIQEDFEAAKKEYSVAKKKVMLMEVALRNARQNGVSDAGMAELEQSQIEAQAAMAEALGSVNASRSKIASTELYSPTKGVVKELFASVHEQVAAGQAIMVVDPKDHFYLFNQSLAIFSFIAFWVFLGIHILAR